MELRKELKAHIQQPQSISSKGQTQPEMQEQVQQTKPERHICIDESEEDQSEFADENDDIAAEPMQSTSSPQKQQRRIPKRPGQRPARTTHSHYQLMRVEESKNNELLVQRGIIREVAESGIDVYGLDLGMIYFVHIKYLV